MAGWTARGSRESPSATGPRRRVDRDQVAAEAALADLLQIDRFAIVLGGSMDGMRAREWAVGYPERVGLDIALATCAYVTGDQIAWSGPQLAAIRNDPHFAGGDYYDGPPPLAGGHRPADSAHDPTVGAGVGLSRFGRAPRGDEDPLGGGRFAVQSYLEHHGDKLGRRFDPNSYLVPTEGMNSHDIGRGPGRRARRCAVSPRTHGGSGRFRPVVPAGAGGAARPPRQPASW